MLSCHVHRHLQSCVGWDASFGTVSCGTGYKQFSPACSACANGWYRAADGSCSSCPADSVGAAGLLKAGAAFFGGGAAILLLVYCVSALVSSSTGFPAAPMALRAVNTLVWCVMVLQVLAQVGRTAPPGLPAYMQSLLSGLAAFQLQLVAFPSACWQLSPFAAQIAEFAFALFFGAVALLLGGCSMRSSAADASRLQVQRCSLLAGESGSAASAAAAVFAAASLLYALVANSVFAVLHCETMSMPLLSYASLNLEGAAAAEAAALLVQAQTDMSLYARQFSVSLVASNPSVVCYSSAHTGDWR